MEEVVPNEPDGLEQHLTVDDRIGCPEIYIFVRSSLKALRLPFEEDSGTAISLHRGKEARLQRVRKAVPVSASLSADLPRKKPTALQRELETRKRSEELN